MSLPAARIKPDRSRNGRRLSTPLCVTALMLSANRAFGSVDGSAKAISCSGRMRLDRLSGKEEREFKVKMDERFIQLGVAPQT